jgi:alpha-L-fucosidase
MNHFQLVFWVKVKAFTGFIFFIFYGNMVLGQSKLGPEKQWFTDAKYGTFIHWCLDNDSGEVTAMQRPSVFKNVALAEAAKFGADDFKPEVWAKEIKSFGSKYAVLTTKHHVGFALFDSPRSRFTAKKNSPAKRDLVKPFVEAIRAQGLRVGLYFSLPDRSHPDYFSLKMKNKLEADSGLSDFKGWERFTDDMLFEISWLCRNYGKIDLFWFDGDWERNAALWKSRQIMDTIKKYQPWAVVNNRLRDKNLGDYATPEMVVPMEAPKFFPAWELCTTLAYNWDGPDKSKAIKSPSEILEIFLHTLNLGGNLLLNISPDEKEKIPDNQLLPMKTVGNWIQKNQEAIFGTEPGLPTGHFDGKSVIKNGNLYLFVMGKQDRELVLKGIEGKIASVEILSSGQKLPTRWMRDYHEKDKQAKPWKFIQIKSEQCDVLCTVIKITFDNQKFSY